MADACRNILLTGIPRSGTTLAAALMDGMENSVCLNEPIWQQDWAKQHAVRGAEAFAGFLSQDMRRLRDVLSCGGAVPDRRLPSGEASTNYFRDHPQQKQARHAVGEVMFRRSGLTGDFTLAVKHNALYLGALPQLVQNREWKIIAIIRHPLGVLASWQVTPIPIQRGQLPAGEIYWRQLREVTQGSILLLEKQVRMYDMMCERLWDLRAHIPIVKYEELVESPCLLEGITGRRYAGKITISRRDNAFYDLPMEPLEAAINHYGTHWRRFYAG